jgi:hypothetical protein
MLYPDPGISSSKRPGFSLAMVEPDPKALKFVEKLLPFLFISIQKYGTLKPGCQFPCRLLSAFENQSDHQTNLH